MKISIYLIILFEERPIYLGFYTCTNSINVPVSAVVVVQMNLPKSKTRMPLPSSIKKAMGNSHLNAPIPNMRRVCSNKHCLVMLSKVTSGDQTCRNKLKTTKTQNSMSFHWLLPSSSEDNFKESLFGANIERKRKKDSPKLRIQPSNSISFKWLLVN